MLLFLQMEESGLEEGIRKKVTLCRRQILAKKRQGGLCPCPKCGDDWPPRAHFCRNCGAPAAVRAIERRTSTAQKIVRSADAGGSSGMVRE